MIPTLLRYRLSLGICRALHSFVSHIVWRCDGPNFMNELKSIRNDVNEGRYYVEIKKNIHRYKTIPRSAWKQ